MSSEADLLRLQLEARLRQAVSKKGTAHESTTEEETAAAACSTQSSSNSFVIVIITVCNGSNCGAGGVVQPNATTGGGSGSGMSATLLEIEELVHEDFSNVMSVQSGGCTDHCTMGPNVFVRTVQNTHHFTKVNSVEACARVVQAAAGLKQVSPPSSSSTNAMLRRADGLRWSALRELARDKVRCSGCIGRELLNQAVDAEIAACRYDPKRIARAERRRRRLLAV
jgi:(2Fe-2S) ferredoxin